MAKKRTRLGAEIPKDENDAERFIRVVTPRVAKAIKAIEVIAFCAAATYENTPAQLKEIVEALTAAVEVLKDKFAGKGGGISTFKFNG